MMSNRLESKTGFNGNGMPLTTRNFINDNNFAASSRIAPPNRSQNNSSTLGQFLPPIAKTIQVMDHGNLNSSVYESTNTWRLPAMNPSQQSYMKFNQLPPLDLNANIFTYFPKSKPFVPEDNLIKYDLSLFDTRIFKKIKFHEFLSEVEGIHLIRYNGKEYAFDLGDNLILRSLKADDFQRDYLKLLEQLTVVGDDVTKEAFEDRFFHMKSCPNTYYVLVVEDLSVNRIIASATLVNEQKFIRHASSKGRIEDVIVDAKYRGKKLGKLLLDFGVAISKLLNCYKISLECKDELKGFYEQFGFNTEEGQNYLCRRF